MAKAITQLVFNMGATVIDMPMIERKEIAEQTMIMIRMILEGARHLDEATNSLSVECLRIQS